MSEKKETGPEVVFTTDQLIEAEQVRALLEARGVLARVLDGNLVSMQPWLSGWAGAIKVVVPAERAEEAREILRDSGQLGGGKTWLSR